VKIDDPMPKPKDAALRRRLIAAASHEFAAAGFAAASMTGIGTAAGVTKGGVYFHFRTKEELFFAVVEHWRDAHRALLAGEPRDVRPPRHLRGFLVEYLRFHFAHPDVFGLMRVLASEMRGRFTTRVRDDHQATLRAVRARIRELLVQGAHEGRLFVADPALATFVLAAAVEGVLSLVNSAPQDAEPFRHPESIVDFLLAPYEVATGGSAPARPVAMEARDGLDFLPPV
jgi:AcrR family transcriptional regulator